MQFLSFLRDTHERLKSFISGAEEADLEVSQDLESDLRDLSRGKLSGFSKEHQRLLADSRSSLKRLTYSLFPEGGDKEAQAKNAYKLFEVRRGEDNRYLGLTLPGEDSDPFDYALGQAKQQIVNELISLDMGDDSSRKERVDQTLKRVGEINITAAYIDRPGIAPVLSAISNAREEITIDIFQLQNKSISDALVQKALEGVTLNIRVAMPDGKEKDATGFGILGPNLLELEKFRQLKERLQMEGRPGDINLFVGDRKSHPKVTITDSEAIIGSLNYTQPVGSDPLASGGNFESIRRLSKGVYTPDMLEGEISNTPEVRSAKLYYQLRSVYYGEDDTTVNRTPKAFLGEGGTRPAFTGQEQVVGPGEIYKELNYALGLAGDKSANRWRTLYAILNQPFLLMLDAPLHEGSMQGEMGKFGDLGDLNNLISPTSSRAKEYRNVQRRLFDLLAENKAQIAVDNRGYIEKVVSPMYERVNALIPSFETEYKGSIEELVRKLGGGGDYTERLQRLTERLQSFSNSFDTDSSRQLLAMTSGNIKLSTVTMQHVKSFTVMEGGESISFAETSSNLGAYSLSIQSGDEELVNREIGLAFSKLKGGSLGGTKFGLTEEEITSELKVAKEHFSKQWSTLTNTFVGDVNAIGTRPWYEGRVYKKGLSDLSQRLKALELAGLSVDYLYGGDSGTERVGLEVSLDVKKLAGFGRGISGEAPKLTMRYSVLEGLGGEMGFVYDLNTGKAIGNSLLQGPKDNIQTPYGELADGKSKVLDPISTTVNLISTLAAESLNRATISQPERFLEGLDYNSRLGAILDYLDIKLSGKRGSLYTSGEANAAGMFFFNAPADELERFGKELQGLSDTDTSKRLTEFVGQNPELQTAKETNIGSALGFLDLLIASEGRGDREWGLIRGGEGEGLAPSLVNLLESSPEFLLDAVNTLADEAYSRELNKGIQNVRDTLMEPFLYLSDLSKYSSEQGWNRLPIYRVTDEMVARQSKSSGGMNTLLSQAMMVPNLYDPSSDLGADDVWRSIASKSTINEGVDENRGLSLYGRKQSPVGDVMRSELGYAIGIGFKSSLDEIKGLVEEGDKTDRLLRDRFRGKNEVTTYTFDTKGKLASIPQRLKNVSGQRGLVPMTEIAQRILLLERKIASGSYDKGEVEEIRGKGNLIERAALSKLSDGELNLASYSKAYTESLREKLIKEVPDAAIKQLVPEDMGLAAIYGGRLRTLMGPEEIEAVRKYRGRLEELLGRRIDLDSEDDLGYYLIHARSVASDVLAGGRKGFTSGRVKRSMVLLQMSGAYGDNFFANPKYGGAIREGFVEAKKVKVRASRLGFQWGTESGLIAKQGDFISFDTDRNQVLVLNAIGLQRTLDIGGEVTLEEVMKLAVELRESARVVDDRAQIDILENVIDSLQRDKGSSLATKTTSSYAATRQGEDAIDYLLSVKPLTGVTSTGSLEYELVYAHSILPNGGRRVDGSVSGGSFKGLGPMADEGSFNKLIAERERGLASSRLGTSINKVNPQDVFGLINPGNLKSYFYQHGAGIIRDAKGESIDRMQRLVGGKTGGQLVAGLLLHFGDAWSGEPSGEIATALVDFLGKGELGEYYKTLTSSLLLKHKGDVEKVGRELLGHKKVGDKYESNLDKYNILQLPGLSKINSDEVLKALKGEGNLAKKLGSLVGYDAEVLSGDRLSTEGSLSKAMRDSAEIAIDISNPLHRQAAILLTSWDVTSQLSNKSTINTGEIWLGKDPEGNRNLIKVASTMGYDPLRLQRGLSQKSQEDIEYAEMVRNVAIGLTGQVNSIFLEMDLRYSQSQEPGGKKSTGNLEGVQMVKPFLNLGTEFRDTGNIGKLRNIIATLIAGMSVGESATRIATELNIEGKLASARNLLDPMHSGLGKGYSYLGLYGSGIEDIGRLQSKYKEYEEAVLKVVEERVRKANDVGTKILITSDPTEKNALESEKAALMGEVSKLVLDYRDPLKVKDLLGEKFKPEYEALLPELKDMGKRYDVLTKPIGVGLGNALVKSMTHERGVYYLPNLVMGDAEGGRVSFKIDSKKGAYSYIPGGEDLQFLGTQYGAHVDDLVMATVKLTAGLTPGTEMSEVLRKVSIAQTSGAGRVDLSPEEAKLLVDYQEAFSDMGRLLAEKGAGEMLAGALGGSTTLKGGVNIASGNWWIPEGTVLASEETLRKHGATETDRLRKYAEVKKEIPTASPMMQSLLNAQADALLDGMSEAGMHLVRRIAEDRTELEDLRQKFSSSSDTERGLYWDKAKSKISANLEGVMAYKAIIPDGLKHSGDAFAVKIGELEMEYFIQAFGGMEELSLVKDYDLLPEMLPVIEEGRAMLEGNKLGGLPLESYQRSLGRGFSFDREGLSGLTASGKKKVVRDKLANLIEGYKDLETHLQNVEADVHRIGAQTRSDLIDKSVQRVELKELIGTLSNLEAELSSIPIDSQGFYKVIDKVEAAVNKLDTSDLLQTITFRNAPFGSTETQRQALSVISGIDTVNEYIKATRERTKAEGGLLLDTTRNKTLTLINPLSSLTLNLGDFDGDAYTSIFTKLAAFHKEVVEAKDKISTHKVGLDELKSLYSDRLKTLEFDPVEFLKFNEEDQKALLISHSDMSGLLDKIIDREERIELLHRDLDTKLLALERAKDSYVKAHDFSIRREVADYLGIDIRYFYGKDSEVEIRGKKERGFLPETLDLSVLPTFIQQGHGLFGGLKGMGGTGEQWGKFMQGLTEAYVEVNGDIDKLMSEGGKYVPAEQWKVFADIEQFRETALTELKGFVGSDLTDIDIESLKAKAWQSGGAIAGVASSFTQEGKLAGKAMGATVDSDLYGMLTKVLGKAGGDILGRTYNTLVGTMFADSPLIALATIVGGDEEVKAETVKRLSEYLKESGIEDHTEKAKSYISSLEGQARHAEALQGFLKDSQQLLRDAIKFKNADDTFLKLQESVERYNDPTLSEGERRDLISNIAGQLGPGPGLKAFMQLEELVNRVGDWDLNKSVANFEGADSWKALGKDFGVTQANVSDLVAEIQLAYKAYGMDASNLSMREVLQYKVSRDLQNLIAAYRFDKSLDADKALLSVIGAGKEGSLNALGIAGDNPDERVRLAFEGSDDRAALRSLRAVQILGQEGFEKVKSSPDKLAALLTHIEESHYQSSDIFGLVGERVSRMTNLRVIGKSLGNYAAGRETELTLIGADPEMLKADVLSSMLQLAASNKLTPEASASYASLLALQVGDVEDRGKMEVALSAMRPKDSSERELYGVLKSFLSSEEATSPVNIKGKKVTGGIKEYIDTGLEATRAGMESKFAKDYKQAFNKFYSGEAPRTIGGFIEEVLKGATPETVRELTELARSNSTNKASEMSMPSYHFSSQAAREKAVQSSRQRVAYAAASLQDKMDIASGVGIGLVASLLFTGGISAETAKEAVSGTVMAIGYSKQGRGGWLAGVGGAFRARMAQMQGRADGEAKEGTWLRDWVLRESGYTLGAIAGTHFLEATGISQKVVSGVAKVFGADVKPLDFDKFASWKGGANTVTGALLSALMGGIGMAIGVALGAATDNFVPTIGALESAAQVSREMQNRADTQAAVTLAEGGPDLEASDDPLLAFLSVSYEISEMTDDRNYGNFEESLAYNDGDYPAFDVSLS